MRKAAWVASHQLGGLRAIWYSHFREKSCSSSAKKRSSFRYGNVTKRFCLPQGLLARWRFTRFGDVECGSLKATFRVHGRFLRADAVLAVWRSQCEGLEGRSYWSCDRVMLRLPTHLQAQSNTPSSFLICRVHDRLDSEQLVVTHSSRAVLHLVKETPDDGAADTTLDRLHGRRSFLREPKKKLRRLLVEQCRLQRWINSKVHVDLLHCSQSSKRPLSCGHCKIYPWRGFLLKYQRFWKYKNAWAPKM